MNVINCHFLAKFQGDSMNEDYARLIDETAALHDRSIRFRASQSFSTLLFIKNGSLCMDQVGQQIDGPALCFWPNNQLPGLQLKAGSNARLLGLSDTLILDAIGARSESVQLRMLVEQPLQAPLPVGVELTQISALFEWFGDELQNPERRSPMSLAAFLRLIFICGLRLNRSAPVENRVEQTDILRRFRHLVELHYREHWPITQYASELGLEYDRLHRICKRETGRTAAELLHERLTAEAKARLKNSGFPVKKIAADLGFSDATRFSHFFKRRIGMSPGTYRTVVSRPDGEDLSELRRGFADWP